MAINNFQGLTIEPSGDLKLQGVTAKPVDVSEFAIPGLAGSKKVTLAAGATIKVTIISCDLDDKRRCSAVVDRPNDTTWDAIAKADQHKFVDNDFVYAIGETHVPDEEPFVWCNLFHIGQLKPLA
jgi:hypothetical protein